MSPNPLFLPGCWSEPTKCNTQGKRRRGRGGAAKDMVCSAAQVYARVLELSIHPCRGAAVHSTCVVRQIRYMQHRWWCHTTDEMLRHPSKPQREGSLKAECQCHLTCRGCPSNATARSNDIKPNKLSRPATSQCGVSGVSERGVITVLCQDLRLQSHPTGNNVKI